MKIYLSTEGTYPFVLGGVSTWVDMLVHGLAPHHASSGEQAVSEAYERGETDEFVEPTLVGEITKTVQAELCTKASTTTTPACPDGTTNVGGTCMYGPGNTCFAPAIVQE